MNEHQICCVCLLRDLVIVLSVFTSENSSFFVIESQHLGYCIFVNGQYDEIVTNYLWTTDVYMS